MGIIMILNIKPEPPEGTNEDILRNQIILMGGRPLAGEKWGHTTAKKSFLRWHVARWRKGGGKNTKKYGVARQCKGFQDQGHDSSIYYEIVKGSGGRTQPDNRWYRRLGSTA